MRRSTILAAFVVATALGGGPGAAGHARAATLQTSLDTLIPGGSNAGGVRLPYGPGFSQFAFRNTGPHELSAADVTVRISNDDAVFFDRVNVQFTFGTPTAATQAGDIFIDYRVDMQDQSSINRVGARFVGSVPSQGAGSGSVFLTQTVSTLNGEDLTVLPPVSDRESLVLFNDGPGRQDDVNSQFLPLNPAYGLRLSAQISLAAREDGRSTSHF